jgi:hypothetical protein
VPYVLADIGFARLKKLDQLGLSQPDSLAFQAHVDFRAAVGGLVDDDF